MLAALTVTYHLPHNFQSNAYRRRVLEEPLDREVSRRYSQQRSLGLVFRQPVLDNLPDFGVQALIFFRGF